MGILLIRRLENLLLINWRNKMSTNNKSVFPIPELLKIDGSNADEVSGITLRDYFAAKAMQAHIAIDLNLNPEEIARWAYRYADAMLVKRECGE